MADGNQYRYPFVADARARLEDYRKKVETYARRPRGAVAQAIHVGEIIGGGALASLAAGTGGPEGRTILGVPVELWIGGALGTAGVFLVMRSDSNRSPETAAKSEQAADHLLALGAGAIAACTNRWVFEKSIEHLAKPPAEEAAGGANRVSGALPAPTICYLPAPPQWMLPAATHAPAMVQTPVTVQVPAMAPLSPPGQAATAGESLQEYYTPIVADDGASIGADEIESAAEILERMNRG